MMSPDDHVGAGVFPRSDDIPPDYSDSALALRFADKFGAGLRYVAQWGKWLEWDGARWQFDTTLRAFDLARDVCDTAARSPELKPSQATKIASASTVAAVTRLTMADRRIAATVDQWDTDPWLLNTPDGVVDLRTGERRPHDRNDCMTKVTAVGPAEIADTDAELNFLCPTWLRFLRRVTDGDTDLQAFLQRMAGYALTGSIREHALFFLYGTGGNGKGVFLNTLTAIMGDYAKVAPMETFIASTTDRHPTDLAMLRGSRLVAAQETEEGRRWAESRIKSLTGGDPITARFMRQDFFTFVPQFKLVIAGNHKPGLRSVDEAIRRRMNLIPFVVNIPPAERDHDLSDKLRSEWPGILRWAVRGAVAWSRSGLAAPAVVTAATGEYLDTENSFEAWFEECCGKDANGFTAVADAFASWKVWADKSGEFVGSIRRFSQLLEANGYSRTRDASGTKRGFRGFWMRSPQPRWQAMDAV